MPTPSPASSSAGSCHHRLQRLDEADRHDEKESSRHRRPEPLDPAGGTAPGDTVAEQDVAHEQRTVQEGPEQAQGIARPAQLDEDAGPTHEIRRLNLDELTG